MKKKARKLIMKACAKVADTLEEQIRTTQEILREERMRADRERAKRIATEDGRRILALKLKKALAKAKKDEEDDGFVEVPCVICGRKVITKYQSSADVTISNYCDGCGCKVMPGGTIRVRVDEPKNKAV